MGIIEILLGGAGGGLLGSLINRFVGVYEKKKERDFILQKYELDAKERARERESEERIVESSAASASLQASYLHDSNIGSASLWVINILRLVRPTLTALSGIMLAVIFFNINNPELEESIVLAVVAISTGSWTWWFADRGRK